MIRIALIVLAVACAVIGFVIVNPTLPANKADGVTMLHQADFVMSDSATPPVSGWQMVQLPDSWRARQPGANGMAWYRIRVPLSAPLAEAQAVYLPRLAVAGELWLNGELLSAQGSFSANNAYGQSADAPFFIVLPASAFHPGVNELAIRMLGDTEVRSGLSAIRFGPLRLLEPLWRRQYLLYSVLPYALGTLLIPALFLAYAYAHRRRQFKIILLCVVLSIASLVLDVIPQLPLSLGERHVVRAVVLTIILWLTSRATYSFSTVRLKWLNPALDALSLATLAGLLVMTASGHASDRVWGLLLPLLAVFCVVNALILETAWRIRAPMFAIVALAELFWGAALAQAFVIPLTWLPWESFRNSSTTAIVLCIALLLFFGERFVREREDAVRQQNDAITAERSRILQDMHDGMGAQLITAKRLALRADVDRKDLALIIDESLQDLRLIIDSLDAAPGDILPLLGNLRFRLQPRLAALGIRLHWDAQPLPALAGLNPTSVLAILRIVQECINNALRHAQPSEIQLSVYPAGPNVIIRVADNGKGFALADAVGSGRGLRGMRLRAEKLGARLDIDSAPENGTRVTLRITSQAPA